MTQGQFWAPQVGQGSMGARSRKSNGFPLLGHLSLLHGTQATAGLADKSKSSQPLQGQPGASTRQSPLSTTLGW